MINKPFNFGVIRVPIRKAPIPKRIPLPKMGTLTLPKMGTLIQKGHPCKKWESLPKMGVLTTHE